MFAHPIFVFVNVTEKFVAQKGTLARRSTSTFPILGGSRGIEWID